MRHRKVVQLSERENHQVPRTADPAGADVDTAGAGACQRHQLLHRAHRRVLADQHDAGRLRHGANEGKVRQRVVAEALRHQGEGADGGRHDPDGVAVRRGARNRAVADVAGGTGPVFDHDGLAELLGQLVLDRANDVVGGATGGVRDHQCDRSRRPRLRVGDGRYRKRNAAKAMGQRLQQQAPDSGHLHLMFPVVNF